MSKGSSNLYTPARQMGLSRIVKKTPNNSLHQITPNQSSSYNSDQLNTPPSASSSNAKTEMAKSSGKHSYLLTTCRQMGLSRIKKTPNKSLLQITPNQSLSDSSKQLNTPPSTTYLNAKTELTPCRQMGLSRKRSASSLSEITPAQSTKTLNLLEVNTTPITSKIESEKAANDFEFGKVDQKNELKEESVSKDSITKQESAAKSTSRSSHLRVENEKPKHSHKNKKVSKCLSKSDKHFELSSSPKPLSSPNSDLFCDIDFKPSKRKRVLKCLDVSKFVSTHDSTNSKESSIENSSKNEETLDFKGFTALQINESKSIHRNFSSNTNNSKLIRNKGNLAATVPETNFKSSTLKTYTNKKKWKRTLSLKKSTEEIKKPEEPTIVAGDAKIKPCTIELHKLNLPSGEMIHIRKLSSNISELENENKKQQKILQDLKQAQLYKTIHNIQDLEKSTETWKNGCKAALNDLLPQVRVTLPNIDMETLLKNLGVPPNKLD